MGWHDIEFDLETPSPPGSNASSPSGSPKASVGSTTTWLDAKDMNVYGPGGVGARDQRIVACNDCNKAVLEGSLAEHRHTCRRSRDAQSANMSRGYSDGLLNGHDSRKRVLSDASGDETSPVASKKTKFLGAADGKLHKKTSLVVPAKPGEVRKPIRNKGPVDVNTQCGVIVNDKPCSRSLTCKSHSIAQKREVPGRSAPFKVLLAEWQARHNPEGVKKPQVSPSMNGQANDGKFALGPGLQTNGRLGLDGVKRSGKARQIYFGEMSDSEASGEDAGLCDSEDEVDQVFAGLNAAVSICRPVATPTHGGALCVRAIKYGRFHDALCSAS